GEQPRIRSRIDRVDESLKGGPHFPSIDGLAMRPLVMSAFCSGCGVAVADNQILYTEDAKIVCARCNGKADIVRSDKAVGNNIRNAALTALCCGIGSWFLNP